MKNLDLLLPNAGDADAQVWATVTALAPLRIKLDGDTAALPFTPDSLAGVLAVNDRVRVALSTNDDPDRRARRLVVLGKPGGTLPAGVAASLADHETRIGVIETAAFAAWSTWTPTLSAMSVGNGTLLAKYRKVGKTLDYRFRLTLGSTSTVGTGPTFTLPFAAHADYQLFGKAGSGFALNSGVNGYDLSVRFVTNTSTVEIVTIGTTGVHGTVTATVPFTFGVDDVLTASGIYETT